MDIKTGALIEADDESIKQLEEDLNRKLIPVRKAELDKVRNMTTAERRAYAKRIAKRRKRRKANRKIKRKK